VLLAFQHCGCELAAALRPVAGFPDLRLLRRLRPARPLPVDDAPALPWPGRPRGAGGVRAVPTFAAGSIDGRGARLCPCGLATPTPQTFGVASRPATL